MINLLVLSNAVSFIGVASALWLGFFNLTRSPQRTLTRIGALTLWAGAGYLLSNLMYYNQLPESASAYWSTLFRVSTFFAPALWLHLTTCFLPPIVYRRRRWLVLGAYVIAALWTVADSITPVLLSAWNKNSPLAGNSRIPGAVYPLFIGYALGCVALIIANLIQARYFARNKPPVRRHVNWAIGASALAGAGVIYLTAITQLGVPAPNLPGDIALVGGVGLMGYVVAYEAARRDGRNVQRDFFYTLFALSLVCVAYLLATLLSYLVYGTPFVSFIFVLMLAVITHSLYDWARSALDRLFFRQSTRELRENLRALAHEAGNDQDLPHTLHALLTALCQSIGASRGALFLRQDGQYGVAATYRLMAPVPPVPPSVVAAHDMVPFRGAAGLSGLSLLAPLRLMDEQTGALLLGPKESGSPYSPDDEDLIADVADRIESVLAQLALREERTRQLSEQVARYREGERALQAAVSRQIEAGKEGALTLPGVGEKEFLALGEDALRHLADIPYLGGLALCQLPAVHRRLQPSASTNLDRGKALKAVLLEALDKLRPAETPEPAQPGREWYPYLILREAYVVGVPNQEIMTRLYISDGTFHRTRRRAVRAVAQALAEMEGSL